MSIPRASRLILGKPKAAPPTEFLLGIIPNTFIGAFAEGNVLHVLFVSVLCGFALSAMGQAGKPLTDLIGTAAQMFFRIVAIVMWAAPLGAFGAIAFTVGKFGAGSLLSLGKLLISFYVTCLVFILAVLWPIAHFTGVSLFRFIRYIREELLIVIAVLPRMIANLEAAGCDEGVVGLVVRTRLFVQPRRHLSLSGDGRGVFGAGDRHAVAAHASARTARRAAARLQGRGGVAGAAFIVLAATLGAVGAKSGRERGDHSRRASSDVAGADTDQSDRQWHRDTRHRPLGTRAG